MCHLWSAELRLCLVGLLMDTIFCTVLIWPNSSALPVLPPASGQTALEAPPLERCAREKGEGAWERLVPSTLVKVSPHRGWQCAGEAEGAEAFRLCDMGATDFPYVTAGPFTVSQKVSLSDVFGRFHRATKLSIEQAP
jgi:hypothetical protein